MGIAQGGKVWMGADSFALADSIAYSCDGKLFRRGEFIIGTCGDWRYGQILFASIGSGSHVAMGSLYESQDGRLDPKARLDRALRAAEALTDGVRAPFIFDQE